MDVLINLVEKLDILADAAKYDVACTSSGLSRGSKKGQLGNSMGAGCCHSFTPDGRCITLLKVLQSNVCIYDCAYCVSRASNDVRRATFTPEELADLTIGFYRRNYIEGLFLSSGVIRNPDYTTELMIRTLKLLREQHGFRGYIHAKTVPGTSPELIDQLGHLADRLSVNLELPSQKALPCYVLKRTSSNLYNLCVRFATTSLKMPNPADSPEGKTPTSPRSAPKRARGLLRQPVSQLK